MFVQKYLAMCQLYLNKVSVIRVFNVLILEIETVCHTSHVILKNYALDFFLFKGKEKQLSAK